MGSTGMVQEKLLPLVRIQGKYGILHFNLLFSIKSLEYALSFRSQGPGSDISVVISE